MIDISPHLRELEDRIAVIKLLITESHNPDPAKAPISREARGLAVLLLYAAYENLLKSLTRTLLEAARRIRASNKRLQPSFRMFAIADVAKSIRDTSEKHLYRRSLRNLIGVVNSNNYLVSTINVYDFPDDGSFMKLTQIELWADIFNIGDPKAILFRSWSTIDSVVTGRNQVAHGQLTPDQVGRNYTEAEILKLIDDWRNDWTDFLTHVETLTKSRDFFRVP